MQSPKAQKRPNLLHHWNQVESKSCSLCQRSSPLVSFPSSSLTTPTNLIPTKTIIPRLRAWCRWWWKLKAILTVYPWQKTLMRTLYLLIVLLQLMLLILIKNLSCQSPASSYITLWTKSKFVCGKKLAEWEDFPPLPTKH